MFLLKFIQHSVFYQFFQVCKKTSVYKATFKKIGK